MSPVNYCIYPSLLNLFVRYEAGKVSEQYLVDRINRVPIVATAAQTKGVSFEEAVIKGIQEDEFDYRILEQVRQLLPRPMVKTQVYCAYALDDVLIYGFVDVIGKRLAVDIKTTSNYKSDSYLHSHQNYYLPALRSKGIQTLRYVITDFKQVYQEEYDQSTDFSVQNAQVKSFCLFLENHRHEITDKKIFATPNS